jgi:dolichol-phosphate mannosyltransferase
VVFALVGGLGLVVHLAVLWICFHPMQLNFELSQATATGVAIISNFTLNNWLTYHDRRLTGWKFVRGLLSFALICSVGAVANVGIATLREPRLLNRRSLNLLGTDVDVYLARAT